MFKKIAYLSFIFLFACSSAPEEQSTRTPEVTLTDVYHNPSPSVTQTAVVPTNTLTPSPTQFLSKTPTPFRPTSTPALEPTSIPQQPGDNIFGVTVYIGEPTEVITKLVAVGTTWTRRDVNWAAIETKPGVRSWDSIYEQDLKNVVRAGLQPILILGETPLWALKPGFKCGAVAEDKFRALGDFAFDLVQRYSGPPYYIKYWELWNEPDAPGILGCWGDPGDQYYGGGYYGEMLKVVYPRIKAADPQAQVLVGGLLLDCDPNDPPPGKSAICKMSRFLEGILESGAGPYFDGVSFHAYDFFTGKGTYSNPDWHSAWNTTGPVSLVKANYLKALLATYGYAQKYLMSTETAVFHGPNVMQPPCLETDDAVLANVEVTKVYYIVHSYTVALAEGWKANVWFSAFGVRCSGLLKTDLSPFPAYYAYQFTRQKLGGAAFVRKLTEYEQVMGYEFRLRNRRIWVLWSLDGAPHTIDLPSLPVLVNRMGDDGKPVLEPGLLNLTIDLSPHFVEFE